MFFFFLPSSSEAAEVLYIQYLIPGGWVGEQSSVDQADLLVCESELSRQEESTVMRGELPLSVPCRFLKRPFSCSSV